MSESCFSWPVLVVDDDPDIHLMIDVALRDVEVLGAPVRLVHASSEAEARALLAGDDHYAVALLDVVLESDEGGLELAREIRRTGRSDTRIVLRTAHSHYAPDPGLIRNCDINDFRSKDELTRARLVNLLTTSIRSYDRLHKLTCNQRGMALIVNGTSALFKRRDLKQFCSGMLQLAADIIDTEPHGLVCVAGPDDSSTGPGYRVLATVGRHGSAEPDCVAAVDETVRGRLDLACHHRDALTVIDGAVILRCEASGTDELLAYLEAARPLGESDLSLLRVLALNLSTGLENLQLIAQLDNLAFVDPDLGIPSRNALQNCIAPLLGLRSSEHRLVLAGLGGLEPMLSAFGRGVVVGLLKAACARLRGVLGEGTMITRFRHDTLALLAPAVDLAPEVVAAVFEQPFSVDGKNLRLTVRLGIVDFALNFGDTDSLVEAAVAALAEARRRPRGTPVHFTPALLAGAQQRLMLVESLRAAIDGDGIEVHLQPKISLATGELAGAEALARWTRNGERVPPDRFVALAESTGLIGELTGRVLQRLGRMRQDWLRRGIAVPGIAVNVSVSELHTPGIAGRLLAGMREAGIPPGEVEIEVTESVLVEKADDVLQALLDLKQAGCSIALDDFGTGFSSLSYLERLPIDVLKLDRCFIESLRIDNVHSGIPAAVIGLADSFGLSVVAEGVETRQQHDLLRLLGCDLGQGYHYARPMAPGDFGAWCVAHRDVLRGEDMDLRRIAC